MKGSIFLAGAAGVIGKRLAPLLVAAGWKVVGTTRSLEKQPMLLAMGVEPVVVDVFDGEALRRIVSKIQPEIIIHQLSDLQGLQPDTREEALIRTARIRDEGTRNLVLAAVEAGVKRVVAQSIALVYAQGPLPHGEGDPLLPETDPVWGATVRGARSLERAVLQAPLDGVVLRYGLLYGPGTAFDSAAGPAAVHVDAAAKAAELAISRGSSGIYNIAEPGGRIANTKAVTELGWDASWRWIPS